MPDLDYQLDDRATLQLDHPLDEYATHLKDLHARRVGEHFDALVRESGVDEQENTELVAELRELEAAVKGANSLRNAWRAAGVATLTVVVASAVAAFAIKGGAYLLLALAVAGLTPVCSATSAAECNGSRASAR